MVRSRVGKILAIVGSVALALVIPAAASALPTLHIEFTGLNLTYTGLTLCDSADCDGGSGVQGESDSLTTMVFGMDNDNDSVVDSIVGVLAIPTNNTWADIALGLQNIPVGGGSVPGGSGIFDILTTGGSPGWGLALDVGSWTATYNVGGAFSGSGFGSIFSQSLPFGLLIDPDAAVSFSFSSQIAPGTLTHDGTYLTGFRSSGTGEVAAPAVPEPGTMLLLGSGLTGLALRRRRKA